MPPPLRFLLGSVSVEKDYALLVDDCACEALLSEECDAVVQCVVFVLLIKANVNAALLPYLDSLTSANECLAACYCRRLENLNAPDGTGNAEATVAISASKVAAAVVLLVLIL